MGWRSCITSHYDKQSLSSTSLVSRQIATSALTRGGVMRVKGKCESESEACLLTHIMTHTVCHLLTHIMLVC